MYILFEPRHYGSILSILATLGLTLRNLRIPEFIHVAVYDESTGLVSELALGGIYSYSVRYLDSSKFKPILYVHVPGRFNYPEVPRDYPRWYHFVLYLFRLWECPCVGWVCHGFDFPLASSPDDLFWRLATSDADRR